LAFEEDIIHLRVSRSPFHIVQETPDCVANHNAAIIISVFCSCDWTHKIYH